MTRMTRPDCAVMCNLINTHTHTPPREDQCEWHRMTRMTGPDCVVMCNLINTHTHTHTHRRTPDGNGDGNGNGDVSEDCSGDGDGDEDNGNENRIGEGGRGTKKRKKPQNSCRRRAGNGGDMGGKRKKCRKERVGSVAANSDNLGSNKEAGGGAQGAQGSSKICTSRESVSPLSRLIRGFRNKYH